MVFEGFWTLTLIISLFCCLVVLWCVVSLLAFTLCVELMQFGRPKCTLKFTQCHYRVFGILTLSFLIDFGTVLRWGLGGVWSGLGLIIRVVGSGGGPPLRH